jgi:hypothetical protein
MQLLSHHTSERALIGIVRSQSLWATEFLTLNDSTEFVFALSALYEVALTMTLPSIPEELRDKRKPEEQLCAMIPEYIRLVRRQVLESDGYDSLYVTSFAQGKDEDEDERGILTLWDRYTMCKGYCLQFNKDHIRERVECEREKHSYAHIELAEVKYGIDQQDVEFKQLANQLSYRMLERCFAETDDHRLMRDAENRDLDSVFLPKLLSFCGKHKDPAFKDEREVRILAYPANVNSPRVLTGVAMRKTIYCEGNRLDGRRHIILGENQLPGITLDRILIGPNTKWHAYMSDGLYPLPPAIKKSDIPIS